MKIIRSSHLTKCWKKHSRAKRNLAVWEEKIRVAKWKNHREISRTFPLADYIPNSNFTHLTVFNISGNHYRLAVDVVFDTQEIYVKWFGSHSAYDSIIWNKYSKRGFVLC